MDNYIGIFETIFSSKKDLHRYLYGGYDYPDSDGEYVVFPLHKTRRKVIQGEVIKDQRELEA